MTCAFNDVVILRDLLLDVKDLADWEQVAPVLNRWFWARKPLASTVNILSVALYDLFGADGALCNFLSLTRLFTCASLQTRISRSFASVASSTSSSVAHAFATPLPSLPRTSSPSILLRHFAPLYFVRLPCLPFSIAQAPFLLFRHFFTVALYSIWVLFTHPRRVGTTADGKPLYRRSRPDEWPLLAIKSVQVVRPTSLRPPLGVRVD